MSLDRWDCKKVLAAEFFQVSAPTIDAWIRNGAPVKKRLETGRVSLVNLSDIARHRIAKAQDRDRDPVAERARRDSEAADKLALENARTRGETVQADTVTSTWVGVMTETKQRLLALPTQLAPQVIGATTEEARALIEEALYDALLSLAESAGAGPGSLETAAPADDKSVGGPEQEAEPGGERGAGALEH